MSPRAKTVQRLSLSHDPGRVADFLELFGKVGVDRDEPKSRRFHPPPYSRRIWPPPISPASVKKAREIMAGSPGGEESIGGGRESIWRMPHESGMGDENLRIRRRL